MSRLEAAKTDAAPKVSGAAFSSLQAACARKGFRRSSVEVKAEVFGKWSF